jgi:hypothetical protein
VGLLDPDARVSERGQCADDGLIFHIFIYMEL